MVKSMISVVALVGLTAAGVSHASTEHFCDAYIKYHHKTLYFTSAFSAKQGAEPGYFVSCVYGHFSPGKGPKPVPHDNGWVAQRKDGGYKGRWVVTGQGNLYGNCVASNPSRCPYICMKPGCAKATNYS